MSAHEYLRFIITRDDAWLEMPTKVYLDFCRRFQWHGENGFFSSMHGCVYLCQFPDAPYFLTRIEVDLSKIPEVHHVDSAVTKYEPIKILNGKEKLI